MSPRSDDPRDRTPGPAAPSVPIWFAFLGPPSAALAHVALGYPLEHTACATGSVIRMHLIAIVFLAVDLFAGWVARREWVRLGSTVPGDTHGPFAPRRLMALIGMIGAAIFALVIVAQWFPAVMLPPCIRT